MAKQPNFGRNDGLGVTHTGSFAKGGTHHFVSGSQAKAMSEIGHDRKHGRHSRRVKKH